MFYFLLFKLRFTVQINIPSNHSFIHFRSSIFLMHNNQTLQTKVSTVLSGLQRAGI